MRGAQPLARWLVAKPLHSVLGLALTLLLPFAQIFSGAAMTVLVLARGFSQALVFAAAAAALVAALSLATGANAITVLVNALMFWLPASLLATLLARTRSLTLSLQIAAVVALAGTAVAHLLLQDPAAFWKEQITQLAAAFSEMGFDEQSQLLVAQQDALAPQMTVLFVVTTWSMVSLVLALGYWVYQSLPDKKSSFGRFCDLDLGRFLAIAMAAGSVLALVTGVDWLQNFALVGFAIFWLQGLSFLHWLRLEGPLPFGVLVVIYGLMPILNVLLILALAALGYSDAWFDYRARIARSRNIRDSGSGD
jgi:hypothetical protein